MKLEFNLTDKQKKEISDVIEKVISEYKNKNDEYFDGVVDGLNHTYKIINGIKDDYLDGIK